MFILLDWLSLRPESNSTEFDLFMLGFIYNINNGVICLLFLD
jgi:hypothetical protein